MKKNVLILVVFGLALLTGCTKKTTTTNNNNNTTSSPGGTWTFKSKTYHPNLSSTTQSIISVKDSLNTDYGSLYCVFPDGLPITAGTYVVIPEGQVLTANQISFELGLDRDPLTAYSPTGGNGAQTVTVSVVNGKVNIAGSGIELYNDTDSSSLTLDLLHIN